MRIWLIMGLLALSACAATREARIASALHDAGLPHGLATCMAEPLGRDLSNAQLNSLARLASLREARLEELGERGTLERIGRNLDPHTMGTVMRAGLGCMLRG